MDTDGAANTKIWLVDFTYTQQVIASETMPNAVACLGTFLKIALPAPLEVRVFKYPEKVLEALQDDWPHLIGFSNYMWNSELTFGFARAMKAKRPRTITVAGGPNYPTEKPEQEAFMRAHPELDFYVVKEGEVAFSDLVKALLQAGLNAADCKVPRPGVHSIGLDGAFHHSEPAERIRDLTVIPSPYLEGLLDEFFDGKLYPIIQTNRGCPFTCTFCVEGLSYYNKVYTNSVEKVRREIDYIGRKMVQVRERGGRNDLFIADSNFGMYKDDLDTCRALAESQDTYGWPGYINVATGKNNKERVLEGAKLIRGALRLAGSVQSLDKEVLQNIKRANLNEQQIMELAIRSSEIGANSYSEVILGLPGDRKESHFKTVQILVDAGFNYINLYQLMLLPGTEMANPETRRKFQMVTKFRVLPRCYGYYDLEDLPINAAQIEEVCVAQSTLPFQDYLQCRKFHLMTYVFYNDGIFGELLKLLRVLGISRFDWIMKLYEHPLSGPIAEVMDNFLKETQAELWDSREALWEFVTRRENLTRYINGEVGSNLLFKHKAWAWAGCPEASGRVALATVIQLMKETGKWSQQLEAFARELVLFGVLRMRDILMVEEQPVEQVFRFDVMGFAKSPWDVPSLEPFLAEQPRRLRFYRTPEQLAQVRTMVNIYGQTVQGRSVMLARVFVKKLLRQVTEQGQATWGQHTASPAWIGAEALSS
ncbi:MAG: cobalamin B12-binding domain-containing protein [Candidatus Omnitrophica bacterium]|nr:cobalamin B12-binding domain-containing protein [Candidatus Omnitrophota bacterium]